MRSLLVFAFLAGTTLPAPAGQNTPRADETPEQFVRRVYAHYHRDGPGVSTSRPDGTPYYAPALLDAFAKDSEASHGEVGAIDSDPLCACQDYGDLKITRISVAAANADTAKAQVTFRNLRYRSTVILTLSRMTDGWRIADVGHKRMKSVKAVLQDSIAHSVQEPLSSRGAPSPLPKS